MNWYSGRRVRSVAAATGLAALLLAAAPGVASAAGAAGGNLPPLQPRTDDLTASYRSCSEDVVYVGAAPELRAVVADSTEDNAEGEANRAGAEFEAWWTDGDGVRQQRAFTTSPLHSPVTALWRTPDDLPPDTVVSWHVRAVDDQGAVSAWSDEAPGHTCRFVIDTVGPQPAAVVSDRYPDDDSTWHDGVGVHGSFTFDSPSEDVVEYVYSFRGAAGVPGRRRGTVNSVRSPAKYASSCSVVSLNGVSSGTPKVSSGGGGAGRPCRGRTGRRRRRRGSGGRKGCRSRCGVARVLR
ncbi:hypothetical protein SALBM217S_06832 [Streptomyces griseoloalbus]